MNYTHGYELPSIFLAIAKLFTKVIVKMYTLNSLLHMPLTLGNVRQMSVMWNLNVVLVFHFSV